MTKMFDTARRLWWLVLLPLASISGQNCPQHCRDCVVENGAVTKATCTDVTTAEIPDSIQDLLIINSGPFLLPFLRSYFFVNKVKLTILKIQNNNLRGLQGHSFQGCPNLELLDLSYNQLSMIEASNFEGLKKMTYLGINGNKLDKLGDAPFIELTALQELHLAHNEITALDDDDFKGLDNVKKIDVGFNKISTINNAFLRLKNLTEIDLAGNQLTNITMGMFDQLENLELLNLKGNLIQRIDWLSLQDTMLTSLNLMQNWLIEIPTEFLQQISNTSLEVSLAANNITKLGEGDLHGVVLKSLILVGNGLKQIHQDAICDSFIQELDFRQNLLAHFPQGLQKYLNQSNLVLLGNNPWSCDCDIQWVKTLLRNNTQQPICSEPLSYHGQPLSQILNDLKISCDNNPHLPVPSKQLPIPPRQIEVTPQLERKTTKCSTPINPNDKNSQKTGRTIGALVGIILGTLFGLLLLILLIITIILIHNKKKSKVATDLNMDCRKPDTNCRTQLQYLPKSNNYVP